MVKTLVSYHNATLKELVTFLLLLVFSSHGFSQQVKVGKQIWQQKNLNVEFFQNGDKIPRAQSKGEWIKALENKAPAWCYFENDSTTAETRGKLYNWYAVNDNRGLAPEGWKIPNTEDFKELNDFYVNDQAQQHAEKVKVFIQRLKSDFENTQNDSLFFFDHSDVKDSDKPVKSTIDFYDENGYNIFTKEQIDSIEKLELGSVIAFNKDNEKITFIKIVGQKDVEYVTMRHILLDQKLYNDEKAKVLADSILEIIREQNNFLEMVELFSDDPSSNKRGGVYDSISRGRMVTGIDDFVFNNDVGTMAIVSTDYGLSIVEITQKKTELRPLVVKVIRKLNSKSIKPIQLRNTKVINDLWGSTESNNRLNTIPAGFRAMDGQFLDKHVMSGFWEILYSVHNSDAVFTLEYMKRHQANYFEKDIGISVRCVKVTGK